MDVTILIRLVLWNRSATLLQLLLFLLLLLL